MYPKAQFWADHTIAVIMREHSLTDMQKQYVYDKVEERYGGYAFAGEINQLIEEAKTHVV